MILWPGCLEKQKTKTTRFITNNYDLLTSSFSKKANQFSSNPKVKVTI